MRLVHITPIVSPQGTLTHPSAHHRDSYSYTKVVILIKVKRKVEKEYLFTPLKFCAFFLFSLDIHRSLIKAIDLAAFFGSRPL